MIDRERLKASIREHEGYREMPYRDSEGYWTIGTGHLLHNEQLSLTGTVGYWLDWMTDSDRHERWLDRDMDAAITIASEYAGEAWERLSDVRREVLVEMAFQLGNRLRGFKKTLALILNEDHMQAALEMRNSKWHEQTPKRAQTLSTRYRDNRY